MDQEDTIVEEAAAVAEEAEEQARSEDDIFLDTLRENRSQWRQQIRGLQFEQRVRKKLLSQAEASSLKVGRYKGVKNERGQPIDYNLSAANTLKQRLAAIEFDLESLEGMVAQADEEITAADHSGG